MDPTTDEDLYRTLGRIEGKLDHVLEKHESTVETVSKNDVRIGNLERSRSYVRGGFAVIAVVLTYVASRLNIPLPF